MHHTPRATRPRWLLLIIAAYIGYVVAYLAILPPLEGFDSFAHFNYINYLLTQRRLPAINDTETAAYSYELPQQPPLYYAASAAAVALNPFNLDTSENAQWTRASENPYQQSHSPRWSVTLPGAPSGFVLSAQLVRIVTALGGLLGVIGTALLARRLFPGQDALQALITSIVAFNPLYIYLSVAISNDAWAVGGTVMALWLLARVVDADTIDYGRWLLFGVAFGLASLTKYSVMLIGVPAVMAVLPLCKRHPLPKLVAAGAIAGAGALLVSGFWHVRNLALYGELAPLRAMAVAIPTLLRPTPMSVSEIAQSLPQLARTYWGVYVGTAFTTPYYGLVQLFAVVGVVGSVAWVARQKHWRRREAFILLCCGACVVAVVAGMISWLRMVQFAGQARLLLIAAPALAILIAFGWRALLPLAWQTRVLPALSIVFVMLPLLPLPGLMHDNAAPVALDPSTPIARVLKARYDDGMQLAGLTFPKGATVVPGEPLPVKIFFQADKPIEDHHTLFLQLIDEAGRILYQFDGVPYSGRHPTRQWRPGELFADDYEITLEAGAVVTPTLAKLIAGFYPISQPDAGDTAYDGNGRPIGQQVVLGRVRVSPAEVIDATIEPPLGPTQAEWRNGIHLVTHDVVAQTEGRYAVALTWQATDFIAQDLTVFVHVLDAQGEMVAQTDAEPQSGRMPTSVWLPGEVIQDRIEVALPKQVQGTRIQIGFYDQNGGQRVPLVDGVMDTFVLQNR